jgi:DNA-directed RNA polymerase subunit beta
MSDLIDIADTPINGNTNLQNSLTVSTHVTDNDVLFDVYDKEFRLVTIPYMDYLNSKVVSSEYVDYDKKSIKPDQSGKIEVKYRMKRRIVNPDEFDLIDLHPDYRLSSTTRRIPFVNFTDSVRISMGTSMIKQSIQLIHAERPLVDTGNNEELNKNVIADRYQGTEGEVVEVTNTDVVIKDDNGDTYKIPKRSYIPSLNQISVYSESKVKVGDRVKNGDVIVGGVTIEKDTAKVGINANVLFHAYHGLINEDAVVVSESFADRMAHY